MEQITLVAPNISCEHCAMAIKRALGKVKGIATVNVDVPAKKMTVAYDPALVGRPAIEKALADEGYPVAKG